MRFSDFVLPNAALADGDIDVNSFQHLPYMEEMMKDRGYKLVSIGKTVLMPLGVYSETVKSLDAIKNGMTVAIPNDPSNGGRALLLLQDRGLIEVDSAKGLLPTVLDVTKNPHEFKFVELESLTSSFSVWAMKVTKAGSISPQRVPIKTPARGVKPIEVSMDRPPWTAVMELPLPRWHVTILSLSTGLSRISAARRET